MDKNFNFFRSFQHSHTEFIFVAKVYFCIDGELIKIRTFGPRSDIIVVVIVIILVNDS